MRKVFTLLLFMLLFQSCDPGKSKDEMLTQETWILHNRVIYDQNDDIISDVYFDRFELVLQLKFNSNGTVSISEDKLKLFATTNWSWGDEDKDIILLDSGKYAGRYYIYSLTSREFEWSKYDNSLLDTIEDFKHFDALEWVIYLSPVELVSVIFCFLLLMLWLVFTFNNIRKWLLRRIHSMMLSDAQVRYPTIETAAKEELPSRIDLQFKEINKEYNFEEFIHNRKTVVSTIKWGYLLQCIIDLIFLIIYFVIGHILGRIWRDGLGGVTKSEGEWYWLENFWTMDNESFRQIWLPVIIIMIVWNGARYILIVNRFQSFKSKFHSNMRPLWNLLSFFFTTRWQNFFILGLILFGCLHTAMILTQLNRVEEGMRAIVSFCIVLFISFLVIHFLLILMMKIRGRQKNNLRLLILRVFGEKRVSQNTFTGLARFWKNFGTYFTLFDNTLYEIDWKNKYNSNLHLYPLVIIVILSIWGLTNGALLVSTGLIILVLAVIGVPMFVYFYNLFIINRDAIANKMKLEKRLTTIERWPTELDYSFKEIPLLCYNNTWKVVIDKLTSISDVILMDLRGYSESNKGCEYEVDFLFDTIRIEKILFITDIPSLSRIKRLLNNRWAMLLESSPNLSIKFPEVNIYLTKDLKYNDKETQDMIDILLYKATTD